MKAFQIIQKISILILLAISHKAFCQIHLNTGAQMFVMSGTEISFISSSDSLILNDSSKIYNDGIIRFYDNSAVFEQPGFPITGNGFEIAVSDTLIAGYQNPGNLGISFNTTFGNDTLYTYRFHSDTLSQISSYTAIKRYYKFSPNPISSITNIQIKYDSTELNGINPESLFAVEINDTIISYNGSQSNFMVSCLTDSLKTITLTPVYTNFLIISDTILCGNDSLSYSFTAEGPYNSGNQFEFLAYNQNDSIILNSSTAPGSFTVSVPDSLQNSPYQLAIYSTNVLNSEPLIFQLTINNLPVVTFPDPTPVCENTNYILLNTASPTGGIYSGTGINGDTLFPYQIGDGNSLILYSYSDLNGCSDTDTAELIIHPVDSVDFPSAPDFCENDTLYSLNALPTGGTYTGTGVIGNYFDPSVGAGLFNVEYIFSNTNACSDTSDIIITVFPAPSNPVIYQNIDLLSTDIYTSYQWYLNGNAIIGETGQFLACDSSGIYQVEVSNADGCSSISDPYNFSLSEIYENSNSDLICLYPNPIQNWFVINGNSYLQFDKISILNKEGKIVYVQNDVLSFEKIIIPEFNSGIYFLKLQTKGEEFIQKMVLIK